MKEEISILLAPGVILIQMEVLPLHIQGFTEFYPFSVCKIKLNSMYAFMADRVLLHELAHVVGMTEEEAQQAEELLDEEA